MKNTVDYKKVQGECGQDDFLYYQNNTWI